MKPYDIPEGVTDVIHAAGRVSDWGPYQKFYEANVVMTEDLMKKAKEVGVKKFLFISTIDIHGLLGHIDETEDGMVCITLHQQDFMHKLRKLQKKWSESLILKK